MSRSLLSYHSMFVIIRNACQPQFRIHVLHGILTNESHLRISHNSYDMQIDDKKKNDRKVGSNK